MKYQATWNGATLAEADTDKILMIEGNVYFPPDSVNRDYFTDAEMKTVCPWKGNSSYYSVTVEGKSNENAAWYYPVPKAGSTDVVSQQNEGKYDGDFSNFVAFWNGVEVKEVE